ncbi:MAG: hypothetical protein ACYT04_73325, partial [Nostoc sp.]
LPINNHFWVCFNWSNQVKFGIETTVSQGFYLICVTEVYKMSRFADIPAEPHLLPGGDHLR